jgi:hypothetical protein
MKLGLMIAAIATCIALPAVAMSDAECDALWRKADANNDGVLSDAEASRYLAALRVQNRTLPPDNRITPAAFKEACLANTFAEARADANAPLKGANSFTEGQAKDRAAAAGYSELSELRKDDDGIWRGTAAQDGKKVNIAIDYKGNVVSQAQ